MSEGPIPWLAMQAYANELGLEDDDREAFFHHMREMDKAFLEHQDKVRKEKGA